MSRPFADESVYRAVAHPVRRRMLDLLRISERPVAELVQAFRLSKQSISHHLRILRTSGLIQQRRQGRQRLYAINPQQLREIHKWTGLYKNLWSPRPSKSPA